MNEKNNKSFWNLYAKIYDFEIKLFNGAAYREMYRRMAQVLTKEMNVLEVATGTGLIAANIAPFVHSVEAIDFSPKMIKTAKKKRVPPNVRFSVQDATTLDFDEQSFDAVIISNALHIMPQPETVLANIHRVLKRGGLLIAPTFSHSRVSDSTWNVNAKILKRIGFETYAKWQPEEYIAFLNAHGFAVQNWCVLKAGFPLVYAEALRLDAEGSAPPT